MAKYVTKKISQNVNSCTVWVVGVYMAVCCTNLLIFLFPVFENFHIVLGRKWCYWCNEIQLFFFKFFNLLFIYYFYFWLCRVFVSV